jgi:BirA family biotin operon repressor/biotin-[acetyl-CoA-carboxylase] ligase
MAVHKGQPLGLALRFITRVYPVPLALPDIESALRTDFIGRRIVHLTSTHSTMDVAREQAVSGADQGTVVVAEEQTAGRGRLGRTWVSPAGQNLYFTLILRPSPERLRTLSIIAPLAISLAVEQTVSLSPSIKWPNDVLLGGRKLSGVLIENEFAGSELVCSLVGIGVNVNFDPAQVPEIAELATSLKRETGREWRREPLLASIFNAFEELYSAADPAPAVDAWRSRLDTLGRGVSVTFRGQALDGTAEDVDHYGNLLVRLSDGSLQTIEAGEVTLRPPSPGQA